MCVREGLGLVRIGRCDALDCSCRDGVSCPFLMQYSLWGLIVGAWSEGYSAH